MTRLLLTLIFASLVALASYTPVKAASDLVPVPPLQSRMTDLTGTLTTDQRAALKQSLRAFETRIEQAIKSAETTHAGQIRFVVEGTLDGTPFFKQHAARERALDLFSQLRMWDTEDNSGVLIYLLLADRQVEIIADRGIHAKAGSRAWTAICRDMEVAFEAEHYKEGAVRGVQAAARQLTEHFPAGIRARNELPDEAVLL